MLTRLTHAAVAFVVTAALYQGYAVTVAPVLEPPGRVESTVDDGTVSSRQVNPLETYRPVLSAYFPADHWCFRVEPKIFENAQSLVVVDQYEQTETGLLRVPRCAIVFFPRGRVRGQTPPRDAIVLEPAGGAAIQMDSQVGANRFGRMQFGQLLGEVVVRSDMQEPGEQDDLRIVTSDLYMNEDLIRTAAPVEMRLGAHRGRGKSLEIRLLPADRSTDAAAGSLYSGLESLEISSEVQLSLAPEGLGRFTKKSGSDEASGAKDADAAASFRAKIAEAPVRINCVGPFRIDFGNYLATFLDRVQVRQLHADGKLDQLSAAELRLYFEQQRAGGSTSTPAPEASPGAPLTSIPLEPSSIDALGNAETPVVLDAPSHGAAARCDNLVIQFNQQMITAAGGETGQPATLSYQGAEIHSPVVIYQFPPRDSQAKVGTMWARGGAGWLRAVPNADRPGETAEVSWKKSMQLVRRDGQPVLVLDGRPKISMVGAGQLFADGIELFLRERRPEEVDAAQAAKIAALPAAIVPQRLTASGRVAIESAELNAKVNQLDVTFQYPAPAAPPAVVPGRDAGTRTREEAPGSTSTDALFGGTSPRGGPRRSYDVSGVTLRVTCKVRDRRPQVSGIRVEGAVVFQEISPTLAAEPPLRITAERLRVTKADTPAAEIEITGGGGSDGLPVQLAEITTPGARLRAPTVLVNRGSGGSLINSPGELEMQVNRDLSGQPLAEAQPLRIKWRDGMELVDRRISFQGDVRVEHAAGWLKTGRLVAQLTHSPLAGGGDGRRADLEQLECWEGVTAEFDQRDAAGLSSHQHVETQSLIANQITGEITGSGPGLIDSVHLSRSGKSLWQGAPGLPGEAASPAAPNSIDQSPQLRRLHITFAREVGGNLLERRVFVGGNVQTVYGAVSDWQQSLEIAAGGSPRPDEMWITCDKLGVVENPLGRFQNSGAPQRGLGPVDLSAEGAVVIEGQHPERGSFTLRGGRATYDQLKGMFVLQGDGVRPATILHQQFPGAAPAEQSAQRFTYFQGTGEVDIQDVSKMQWNNFNRSGK
jgi:hypothetical protein